MNSFIESLNQWGSLFADFAWPMLWQSSLLILVVFTIDWLSRNKIRASVRYALWLVVLIKLCLPPTFASPTSPVWWLHKTPPPAAPKLHYTVSYDTGALPDISLNPPPAYVPPKPAITAAAWLSLASGFVSALLFAWLLARWGHITRQVHRAKNSERLNAILNRTRRLAGVKSTVPVRLTEHTMSPAVCGLFHPVILVPQSLADGFSDDQLRAVLLHELFHLRRRDVWLNLLQALVQIVYWWHPLVWLANARIRRVREEAVDDAVMLTLRDEGDSYAPTLLEVAKLALNRPLAGLGLVGILESRSALRERIERLVNFRAPRKAGLTLVSLLGIMAFTAVAVPMGEAPIPAEQLNSTDTTPQIHIKARFIELPGSAAGDVFLGSIKTEMTPLILGDGGPVTRATLHQPKFIVGANSPGLYTGIMTESQFRTALHSIHAISHDPGFEELAEPEVTTTSGRQTEMRATQIITIITNFVFTEGPDSGSNSITPLGGHVEIGPLLDVVPDALPDGYTIDLKTIASVTEFLGYHWPTNGNVVTNRNIVVNAAGQRIDMPTISPSFAIREAIAHVKLWDGQTVVLGGMKGMNARFYDGGKWVNQAPDFVRTKRPGDHPNRPGDHPNGEKKELLVFVTVTLVDSAGNRIHSDDEMPFAKNSIPPQDQ